MIILRYFNPVGAHPSGTLGEDPTGVPNNLMPYVAQVAVGNRPCINVFGNDYNTIDGTGVRDYLHIMDLAEGHVSALHKLQNTNENGAIAINLGTGNGYSVIQVMNIFFKYVFIVFKKIDKNIELMIEKKKIMNYLKNHLVNQGLPQNVILYHILILYYLTNCIVNF